MLLLVKTEKKRERDGGTGEDGDESNSFPPIFDFLKGPFFESLDI